MSKSPKTKSEMRSCAVHSSDKKPIVVLACFDFILSLSIINTGNVEVINYVYLFFSYHHALPVRAETIPLEALAGGAITKGA